MIKAYQAGVPGNGKPFPDGAKMAKIHWNPKKMETFPAATVPGTQHDVDFMVKDSKRFADSGGWGYAVFDYDTASDTFAPGTMAGKPPQGNDAKCGFACHTRVKARDYVFHGLRAQVNQEVSLLTLIRSKESQFVDATSAARGEPRGDVWRRESRKLSWRFFESSLFLNRGDFRGKRWSAAELLYISDQPQREKETFSAIRFCREGKFEQHQSLL